MAYLMLVSIYALLTVHGLANGALEAWCNISATSGQPSDPIVGTVHLMQPTLDSNVTIEISLSGFNAVDATTLHGFHVHKTGALDNMCVDAEGHYNPNGNVHGGPTDAIRHVGDLGNIEEGGNGSVVVTITDWQVKLAGDHSVMNRAFVVHERDDDLGKGSAPDSNTTGAAGKRLGCCVITQVAGSEFENTSGAPPLFTPFWASLAFLILTVLIQ